MTGWGWSLQHHLLPFGGLRPLIKGAQRSSFINVKKDIHKLAASLERVTHEGIALESRLLQWKGVEEISPRAIPAAKAG